jgi:hypothetical protein
MNYSDCLNCTGHHQLQLKKAGCAPKDLGVYCSTKPPTPTPPTPPTPTPPTPEPLPYCDSYPMKIDMPWRHPTTTQGGAMSCEAVGGDALGRCGNFFSPGSLGSPSGYICMNKSDSDKHCMNASNCTLPSSYMPWSSTYKTYDFGNASGTHRIGLGSSTVDSISAKLNGNPDEKYLYSYGIESISLEDHAILPTEDYTVRIVLYELMLPTKWYGKNLWLDIKFKIRAYKNPIDFIRPSRDPIDDDEYTLRLSSLGGSGESYKGSVEFSIDTSCPTMNPFDSLKKQELECTTRIGEICKFTKHWYHNSCDLDKQKLINKPIIELYQIKFAAAVG